uniref:Uncharacterized protein n=1 Tax=Tanacetum cinerariifolium TaxID=118510 RepID=A0A6L2JUW9_TANCI|nr:hypothetical protein [Tanacetum cinerariifolium]
MSEIFVHSRDFDDRKDDDFKLSVDNEERMGKRVVTQESIITQLADIILHNFKEPKDSTLGRQDKRWENGHVAVDQYHRYNIMRTDWRKKGYNSEVWTSIINILISYKIGLGPIKVDENSVKIYKSELGHILFDKSSAASGGRRKGLFNVNSITAGVVRATSFGSIRNPIESFGLHRPNMYRLCFPEEKKVRSPKAM